MGMGRRRYVQPYVVTLSTHKLVGQVVCLGCHRQQIVLVKLFGVIEAGGEVGRTHCHTLQRPLLIDLELFGIVIV